MPSNEKNRPLKENSKKASNSRESEPIRDFRGDFGFLSNSYFSPFLDDESGLTFPSVEHCLQALKFKGQREKQEQFTDVSMSPVEARLLGSSLELSEGEQTAWEGRKIEELARVLSLKFSSNPYLAHRLISAERAGILGASREASPLGRLLEGEARRLQEGISTRVLNRSELDQDRPFAFDLDTERRRLFVGPGSIWANPFELSGSSRSLVNSVEGVKERRRAVRAYLRYLPKRPALLEMVSTLKGADLICYCSPLDCHAYVLAALADGADLEKLAI